MAQFPIKEADILSLAQLMRAGLQSSSAVFPTPPVTVAALQTLIINFSIAREKAVAAQAAAEAATEAKIDLLEKLVDGMKTDLAYAENAVSGDDDKLKLLGWSGRKTPTKTSAPGQPRNLEILSEAPATIALDWKKPAAKDGGEPKSYRIECRQLPANGAPTAWELKGLALDSEATLTGLPQGVRIELRVIAINKSGESEPSNTVSAMV